jgi:serine/threonine-protein kinase
MRPDLAKGATEVLPVERGRIVGGKYELVRRLGGGSMGEVWVAEHRSLNERVAVKLMTRGPSADGLEDAASAAARFRFEAKVAARLSRATKHVVQVTDHGEEGTLGYLVMELLQGTTLEALLLRHGPIAPDRLTIIVRQIAQALEVAHGEGVVHRDLKPANVFLAKDEHGHLLVKLLDFGIARAVRPMMGVDFRTAANVILGTPGYMSPEHVAGESAPDRHCDIWALATVIYESLTAELPVPGVEADELIANMQARRFIPIDLRAPDLPRALGPFFDRAFSPRVDDRFETAQDVARAFESAVRKGMGTRPISSTPPPPAMKTAPLQRPEPATTVRRARPHEAPWRQAAAYSIGVLILIGSMVLWRHARTPETSVDRGAPGSTLIEPAAPTAVVVPPAIPPPAGAGTVTAATADEAPAIPPPAQPPAAARVDRPEPRNPGLPIAPAATGTAATPSRDSTPKPSASAKPKAVDCSVPYEFDPSGAKHWKRECL